MRSSCKKSICVPKSKDAVSRGEGTLWYHSSPLIYVEDIFLKKLYERKHMKSFWFSCVGTWLFTSDRKQRRWWAQQSGKRTCCSKQKSGGWWPILALLHTLWRQGRITENGRPRGPLQSSVIYDANRDASWRMDSFTSFPNDCSSDAEVIHTSLPLCSALSFARKSIAVSNLLLLGKFLVGYMAPC